MCARKNWYRFPLVICFHYLTAYWTVFNVFGLTTGSLRFSDQHLWRTTSVSNLCGKYLFTFRAFLCSYVLLLQYKVKSFRENSNAPKKGSLLRNFCTEQIFALVSMRLRNHADAPPVKRFKRQSDHAIYIRYINFGCKCARRRYNCSDGAEWDISAMDFR